MKQFNYEITDTYEVRNALEDVYSYTSKNPYKSILFHIYSILLDDEQLSHVQETIKEFYSDAQICGTSTNGDICDGHLADYGMVLSVSVFEESVATVHLLTCKQGQEKEAGAKIREIINTTEDIRAAEILITLKSINCHAVLDEVELCRQDVLIFGGGSADQKIESTNTKVLDKNTITHSGIVLITYLGSALRVDTHHAIGWKPLVKDLTVTRIDGKKLYELDNVPAIDVYSKYLDIKADENFFSNILEFPIMSKQHGEEVLRLPFSCNSEDGSINLAADLAQGSIVNLCYGDPDVIKGDVYSLLETVQEFAPQAIFLYSCGVRRLYWKYLINKETGPFSNIAPVSGFYSSGEILRMGSFCIEHHVALIAISMREGEKAIAQPTGNGDKFIAMSEEQKMHGQISMVRRLANFINVTASELRDANNELKQMAETDELTNMYNRRMIDKLVRNAIDQSQKFDVNIVLGIIDIDDFKQINDNYGHSKGDIVLKKVSQLIQDGVETVPGGICGRWGGEEFLFFLPLASLDIAKSCVDKIRLSVSNADFGDVGEQTVSIGMTSVSDGETADEVFKRADKALYQAKETGKNRICINT